MILKDRNGRVIGLGATARPTEGIWANKEGLITEINESIGNITLEFENGEIGVYFNHNIVMC
ncbi:hypothetical protein ABER99_20305 [Paenibacillus glucanolyticus]|jgi:hypothetical protein|uniref:Uncharacterized protein n=1 Tax=Paenibacillus glucanolyticus TaxID=59843 RepID=A0A163GJN3_9BACL|nr:hypothetical protein [Paenibacillus glucanolyticus]KZS45007.1 hypothetical protein AWU65_03230 [Paenibacillus glucanolyticus]OMF64137.1 hypothetical protein BK142_32105 [Paenibacillus glucanolyticus]